MRFFFEIFWKIWLIKLEKFKVYLTSSFLFLRHFPRGLLITLFILYICVFMDFQHTITDNNYASGVPNIFLVTSFLRAAACTHMCFTCLSTFYYNMLHCCCHKIVLTFFSNRVLLREILNSKLLLKTHFLF